MSRVLLLFPAACFVSALCFGVAMPFSSAEESLNGLNKILLQESGLRIEQRRLPIPMQGSLYMARIDLGQRELAITVPGDYANQVEQKSVGATGLTVRDYILQKSAVVALSGGYVKEYFPPIPEGYLQVNGEPLNRKGSTAVLNAVACTSPNKLLVDFYQDQFDTREWQDCLQAGPMLIADGRDVLLQRVSPRDFITREFERAFLGVDTQGHAVLAVSDPIRLDVLSAILASGQLGSFKTVMCLPGAGSAGLAWRAQDGSVIIQGNEAEFLADAIIVH